MGRILKAEKEFERELPPEGIQGGICAWVILIGTQTSQFGPKEQVILGFEMPEHRRKWTDADEKEHDVPAIITKDFTWSLAPKSNLRKFLNQWRGRDLTDEEANGLDVETLIGAHIKLNISHDEKGDKTWANIASAGRWKKDMPTLPPEPETPIYYDVADHNEEQFKKLPKWIQTKAHNSEEMRGRADLEAATQQSGPPTTTVGFDDQDDGIPF